MPVKFPESENLSFKIILFETISKLTKGVAYYRDKGVEHNVFNNNNFPYSFIEVEMVD